MPDEAYTVTVDGKAYKLWNDIHVLMDTLRGIYWLEDRNDRRNLGYIFRGQANAEWSLIPSLYRPPSDAGMVRLRMEYTDAFLQDLCNDCDYFDFKNLSIDKLMAVAQHYEFYTSFLDFTWNIEVAAYFATLRDPQHDIGCLFAFGVNEYSQARNPFAAYNQVLKNPIDIDEAAKIMAQHGDVQLPPLKLVEFSDIPRTAIQEGVFIDFGMEKSRVLMEFCIDRFYFRQRTARGDDRHRDQPRHLSQRELKREILRSMSKPVPPRSELGKKELFPEHDPVSEFVDKWREAHPDPTKDIDRLKKSRL
jgi:hypothetical protein